MNYTGNIEKYRLPRNYFNRSATRLSSYKVGKIYPVWSDYVLPGDTIKLSIENVTRQLPTVSPSYSNFTVTYRTFFVALRNLWKDFPQWLTGFKTYNKAIKFEDDVPRWTPSSAEVTRPGSLWTSLGFPMNTLPHKMPADFKRQAYGYIYDKYFRYQPFYDSILNEEQEPGSWTGEDLLDVIRDRDYFTTGLPSQQLGDPLALPIVGNAKVTWNDGKNPFQYVSGGWTFKDEDVAVTVKNELTDGKMIGRDNTNTIQYNKQIQPTIFPQSLFDNKVFTTLLSNNNLDIDTLSSVSISMLREAMQIQLFREMLARSGIYYDDVLVLNWGTRPSDETLGYPVYIGGNKINLITSEVLQTSASSDTQPLGQLGGHGLGVGESGSMKYTAKEFGVIMTLMYIKTDNAYGMQHLNKDDLFESNLSIPWIMLQHLSEQPVKNHELFCPSQKICAINSNNQREWIDWNVLLPESIPLGQEYKEWLEKYPDDTLMYREIYDNWRYRTIHTEVDGLFALEQLFKYENGKITGAVERKNYYNWSEAMFFSQLTDNDGNLTVFLAPSMNENFLNMKTDNRNYSVIDTELNHLASDNFMMYTKVKAHFWRVLDLFGTPGRVDHIS